MPTCRSRPSASRSAIRGRDRGLARSDIVSFAAVSLSFLILAIPVAWVSQARADAESALSPILSRPRAESDPASSREIRRLQLEIIRLEDERRNLEQRLERATGFKERIASSGVDLGRFIDGSVIGHAVNWQERSFLVDKGLADGVVVRAGCMDGGMAIGVVVEVGEHASRVAMLSEPGVRIAARTLVSRRSGLLLGSGRSCELTHVEQWSASAERPHKGENLVTSGRLGFFPPGFLIGRIASVGDSRHSLELNIAVEVEVSEPPHGRVWILRPLANSVKAFDTNGRAE